MVTSAARIDGIASAGASRNAAASESGPWPTSRSSGSAVSEHNADASPRITSSGASLGRHTHGENEELYLILEGRGTMHLEGREFPVRAGHLVLNPRNGTHGLVNDSDAPLRIFVVEVACGEAEEERGG